MALAQPAGQPAVSSDFQSRHVNWKVAAPALPRLSIVIVNYNQWEETADLAWDILRSAESCPGKAEIVIVDNHSLYHPLARQLQRIAGVSLRRWRRNHGFARGANEGCRLSRGSWFLLLNPDISVGPEFLHQVLSLIEHLPIEHPSAGIVGFHLRNSDGSLQLSSGKFPSFFRTVIGLSQPRTRRKYSLARASKACQVPWVTGCCLLVRRECFEQLGGFDEDFFLYYEDVDLCLRAREREWSVWYEPGVRATHHHPLQDRPVPAAMRLITRHALLTYGVKHWPSMHLQLLAGLIGAEAWLRRWWAWRRGDMVAAEHLNDLRALALDVAQGRRRFARRRLEAVVRAEERRRAT
jgi:GT2 family glycosyltransferase